MERLSRPDVLDLFTAGGRQDDEAAAARAEAQNLRTRLDTFYDEAASGRLSAVALSRIEGQVLAQIATAERRAYREIVTPLLGEVYGAHAQERWDGLGLEQRRELISLLVTVRLLPVGRGHRTFDPASVELRWKT